MNKKTITIIQVIGVLIALLGLVIIIDEPKNTFPSLIRDKGLVILSIGGLVSALAPTLKIKKDEK